MNSRFAAALPFSLLLASSVIGAAQSSADSQAAPKTYTLFEGENISVGQGSELHPVRDVSGGSWMVEVNGQQVAVSASSGPINMKMTPSLKLTQISADISNLKGNRAYTFANDPSVKLTRGIAEGAEVNAGSHAAVSQATATSTASMAAEVGGARASAANSGAPANTQASNVQASSDLTQAAATNDEGADLSFVGSLKDTGDFDAFDVAFDVSSQTPLGSPYVVMITRFHEPGAAEGSARNLVFAKPLDPIGTKATRVKIEQAGLPPGYELKGFEIHLYDNGVEVATSVAPKRQALTADGAFAYVRTKYIEAHKGETLAAQPAMVASLPADLQQQLAAGKYGGTIFVRVTKDGMADDTFADAACTRKIDDPYLRSVVEGIRFKPALSQGEPVEGVAPLQLSNLRS
jgi:hypothetical protein